MRSSPLLALVLCAFATCFAAYNWTNVPTYGEDREEFVSAARAEQHPAPPAEPRPPVREASDSGFRGLMRFLADTDDILDQIRGPASFEAAKPKLVARTRRHAAWASSQPQGEFQLSGPDRKEFAAAAERHAKAMQRAERVAPGVEKFLSRELQPLLKQN